MWIFFHFIYTGSFRYLVNVFIFSFLDHTQGSHYHWHGDSFKVPHFFFQFLFPVLSIYLLYSLTDMLLSVGFDLSKRKRFSIIGLHRYIGSIDFDFSISLDRKVLENSSSFSICYWFWLVFIPFFTIQYSIISTYFPMHVMSFIIIIIIIPCEFFTPALVNGRSMESKWQQISSSL